MKSNGLADGKSNRPSSRCPTISVLSRGSPARTVSLYRRLAERLAVCLILVGVLSFSIAQATPPEYKTFKRAQQIHHDPLPEELLRIWVVYVGQGDGILIQLPEKYNYDAADDEDDELDQSERIDILIDGGSHKNADAGRMGDFIQSLYPDQTAMIEYAVLTHHDKDHVLGMTRSMTGDHMQFATVYHNGLASYKAGSRDFPNYKPVNSPAIYSSSGDRVTRGMAFLDQSGGIASRYLIENLAELRQAVGNEELQGLYEDFSEGVIHQFSINDRLSFPRVFAGAPFFENLAAYTDEDFSDLHFDLLWPQEALAAYGSNGWGETVNGNSVTFRLSYGHFSMLFTGDMNEHSEEALLEHLAQLGEEDTLNCDVLKVPHHGSSHAYEPFFKRPGFAPVLSVASMGEKGFQSKQMSSRAWQHPDPEVIRWLGRSHRFYSTYIHEKRFAWSEIVDETQRQRMIEHTNILIETDGKWFRIVELPIDYQNPQSPPSVTKTRRGNGTRWISAGEGS